MVASRETDEHVLSMIKARADGAGPQAIGDMIGKTSQYVTTAVNRVRNADLKESGEDHATVLAHYWG